MRWACWMMAAMGPFWAHGERTDMTISQDSRDHTVKLAGEPILRFTVPMLGKDVEPEVTQSPCANGWQHVRMTWTVARALEQDELAV